MAKQIFICFENTKPGPRGTECPDPLHDHPLPVGYCAASNEADRRLEGGWENVKCPACGQFGWAPASSERTTR